MRWVVSAMLILLFTTPDAFGGLAFSFSDLPPLGFGTTALIACGAAIDGGAAVGLVLFACLLRYLMGPAVVFSIRHVRVSGQLLPARFGDRPESRGDG
jgi:hypothetical protein